MSNSTPLKTLMILPQWGACSETFFREQALHLPGQVEVLYNFHEFWQPKTLQPCAIDSPQPKRCCKSFMKAKEIRAKIPVKLGGYFFGKNWQSVQRLKPSVRLIQQINPDVILFQYGTTASYFVPFLKTSSTPFVVHFHGFDASIEEVIQSHFSNYLWLLENASAIVTVSRQMQQTIISWGAGESKVFYNPCGVDESKFSGFYGYKHSAHFLSVGRFVEKKAPHLLVHAFAKVLTDAPQSRLTMVGDGPLLPMTLDLAQDLGVAESIEFKKALSHEEVVDEMTQSGCFVQHSVRAANGDSEGTPVSVMEAMMAGLPVVATAHAGIRDIIENERNGLLVEEHDIDAMAQAMLRVIREPALAARLGQEARKFAQQNLVLSKTIGRLADILRYNGSCPVAEQPLYSANITRKDYPCRLACPPPSDCPD